MIKSSEDIAKIKERKQELIEKLLGNEILHEELKELRDLVNAEDLSSIIQRIYDLNETYIYKLAEVETTVEKLNKVKNSQRNKIFFSKIRKGFRDTNNISFDDKPANDKPRKDKPHITVLAEGDSWFNYPIILTDIIDRIIMEKNLAVYSIASGGDWLLNMLTGRQYVEELSISRPDWFLISGGGNDLVGARRLATILQPDGGSVEFDKNQWTQYLIDEFAEKKEIPLKEDFYQGLQFLSKDFYALLMFFHLQYYFLFNGILKTEKDCVSKFEGLRIITQGYDYPLPSFDKKYGINPLRWYVPFIRKFLGHGGWLKMPLQIRGINDEKCQQKVLYSMIYLFNEMMIELGQIFNEKHGKQRVFHIDSRDSVGENGWADELHPLPAKFIKIGQTFIDCINYETGPTYKNVYVVKKCNP
jgi:hypothetical protein